jgi:hypothetical protein
MWTSEINLDNSVSFILQLSTLLMFSSFLIGFVIKKMMQFLMKGI